MCKENYQKVLWVINAAAKKTCSTEGMKKVSNHGSIPITIDYNVVAFVLKKYGPMIPPAHKAHQTVSFSGCNGVLTYTCGLASLQMRQFVC
ncbi:hypothetical protein TNCV_922781 [Trichonephila clavipes]|nr:hypothetical protein TNCV_922781 [Trichonephila clavipes]